MTNGKERQTQYPKTDHRRGFSTTSDRRSKANKILVVLNEFRRINSALQQSLLDIGTGSGEIASNLSEIAQVTSVDVEDVRTIKRGFQFIKITDETLPFPDRSFDFVISNHVIEHLNNPQKHISEIARVLKDTGIVYLATPNRIWPWEFHYQLPLLHYLPNSLFNLSLRMMKRYKEDVKLFSILRLKKLLNQNFTIHLCSDRMCKWPEKYQLNYPAFLSRPVNMLPLWVYTKLALIHPTFVFILEKKDDSQTQ